MKKILIVLFLLQGVAGFGQTDSVKNLIDKELVKVMGEIREGVSRYYPDFNELLISYPEYAFRKLKEYEYDTSDLVIKDITDNYKMLKSASKEQPFRQKIVFELLEIYQRHKQYSNSYSAFFIPSSLSDPERTRASDFDKKAQDLLASLLQDSLISRDILKAIGIAGMKDQIPELQKFLPEGERYRKTDSKQFYFLSWEWCARLAMARLGDKQQIGFCVEKIEGSEEKIISNPYAAGDYFDDMVYIKKPEVLPFLFYMLIANKEFERKPLHSTSGLAIYALQRLLVNFPPEVGFSLTKKGEKYYRKWVRRNKGKYEFKE